MTQHAVSSVLRIHLSCIPPTTTHQDKHIVKIGAWSRLADKPTLIEAKSTLDSLLLPHQLPRPIDGPYIVAFEFTWPWQKGARKWERALGRIPMTSRPDASNLAKTLEDRLSRLKFIHDDNAVVELHVRKWWGDEPGIDIAIASITQRAEVIPAANDLFAQLEEAHP